MATTTAPLTAIAAALIAAVPMLDAHAGEPGCAVPTYTIYTTQDVYLDERPEFVACLKAYFPVEDNPIEGWTDNEGIFGQVGPTPVAWNALDGLALAIQECYAMPVWPFFAPGYCGYPMYPRYEGEYGPFGFGREWVMNGYIADNCDLPTGFDLEFRVPVVSAEFCPEPLGPDMILTSSFEQ